MSVDFLVIPKIVQQIACFLEDDTDLTSFASVCASVAYRVLPSHSSVWRKRFEDQYDLPQGHDSTEIKIEYQMRAIVLGEKVSFRHEEQEEQVLWLEVIKTLLLESYHPQVSHSKNLDRVGDVLYNSDFLHRPISGHGQRSQHPPSHSFCAVQLVSTHRIF
jgi:hypothetical protein